MKSKIYSVLIAGILLSGFSRAHAESGQCGDDVYWSFESSVLTVSGQGVLSDCTFEHLKDQIKVILIEEGVTALEDVFGYCSSLTSVILPGSLVQIGALTFSDCFNLITVITLNSVPPVILGWEAFQNYGAITAYVPSGSLGAYQSAAFWDWYRLVESENPGYITGVSFERDSFDVALEEEIQLTAIALPYGAIFLPDGTVNSGFVWQSSNPQVATVSQTGLVTGVSAGSAIISVTTADGGFVATATVNIFPLGQCGDSVYWFYNTDNKVLTISGTGPMYDYAWTSSNIDLPPWYNWDEGNIRSVIIKEGVTSIGNMAFVYHENLNSVSIPEGVTSIGLSCFYGCVSLTSVILPASVTSLDYQSFARLSSLTSVTCLNPVPPACPRSPQYGIFANSPVSNAILYVPAGAGNAYRNAADWKEFGNIVVDGGLQSLVLTFNGSVIPFSFNPDTLYYNVTVSSSVTAVTVAAVPGNSGSTVTVKGDGSIHDGINDIRIDVVAADGIITSTYKVTVDRPFSGSVTDYKDVDISTALGYGDLGLQSLTVSPGVLRPAFDPDSDVAFFWADTIPSSTELLTVNAVPKNSGTKVRLIGAAVGADPSGDTLHDDWNDIYIEVSDINDWRVYRDYRIRVYRISSLAVLKSLRVTAGDIDFQSDVYEYTVSVPYSTDTVKIEAIADAFSSSIKATVTGTGRKNLDVGDNPFDITVTAEDRITTLTYRVNIYREANAALKSLTVSGTDMAFLFRPDRFDYAFIVNGDMDGISIKAVPDDAAAGVTGAGYYPLAFGENSFPVTVRAVDGTERTYTVKIRRLSNDATLESLTVEEHHGRPLEFSFSPGVFYYSLDTVSDIGHIEIIAIPNSSFATVSGDSVHWLVNKYKNVFPVTVTAEDRTKLTYTVEIYCDRDGSATYLENPGKQPVQVYTANGVLHVNSSVAERINVYAVTGTLLYSFDKPAGRAVRERRVNPAPTPVLIVKGSSGWVRKIVVND